MSRVGRVSGDGQVFCPSCFLANPPATLQEEDGGGRGTYRSKVTELASFNLSPQLPPPCEEIYYAQAEPFRQIHLLRPINRNNNFFR